MYLPVRMGWSWLRSCAWCKCMGLQHTTIIRSSFDRDCYGIYSSPSLIRLSLHIHGESIFCVSVISPSHLEPTVLVPASPAFRSHNHLPLRSSFHQFHFIHFLSVPACPCDHMTSFQAPFYLFLLTNINFRPLSSPTFLSVLSVYLYS